MHYAANERSSRRRGAPPPLPARPATAPRVGSPPPRAERPSGEREAAGKHTTLRPRSTRHARGGTTRGRATSPFCTRRRTTTFPPPSHSPPVLVTEAPRIRVSRCVGSAPHPPRARGPLAELVLLSSRERRWHTGLRPARNPRGVSVDGRPATLGPTDEPSSPRGGGGRHAPLRWPARRIGHRRRQPGEGRQALPTSRAGADGQRHRRGEEERHLRAQSSDTCTKHRKEVVRGRRRQAPRPRPVPVARPCVGAARRSRAVLSRSVRSAAGCRLRAAVRPPSCVRLGDASIRGPPRRAGRGAPANTGAVWGEGGTGPKSACGDLPPPGPAGGTRRPGAGAGASAPASVAAATRRPARERAARSERQHGKGGGGQEPRRGEAGPPRLMHRETKRETNETNDGDGDDKHLSPGKRQARRETSVEVQR